MQAGTWSLVDQKLVYGIAGSPAGLAVVFAGLEVAPLVGDHLRNIRRSIMKLMPQFTSERAELPLLKDHLERVREEKDAEKDAIIVRQWRRWPRNGSSSPLFGASSPLFGAGSRRG